MYMSGVSIIAIWRWTPLGCNLYFLAHFSRTVSLKRRLIATISRCSQAIAYTPDERIHPAPARQKPTSVYFKCKCLLKFTSFFNAFLLGYM